MLCNRAASVGIMNNKINFLIILLSCIILLFYANTNAHSFLLDEIVASVNNRSVTLNELYFFGNFRTILYKKHGNFNEKFNNNQLKRLLDIYINRILILNDERGINIITIRNSAVNNFIKKFKNEYRLKYKNLKFSNFLARFGYNNERFFYFIKDILIEREFIVKRLKLFFNISRSKTEAINLKGKQVELFERKELTADLKNWIKRLRKNAKIDIISKNF